MIHLLIVAMVMVPVIVTAWVSYKQGYEDGRSDERNRLPPWEHP